MPVQYTLCCAVSALPSVCQIGILSYRDGTDACAFLNTLALDDL